MPIGIRRKEPHPFEIGIEKVCGDQHLGTLLPKEALRQQKGVLPETGGSTKRMEILVEPRIKMENGVRHRHLTLAGLTEPSITNSRPSFIEKRGT